MGRADRANLRLHVTTMLNIFRGNFPSIFAMGFSFLLITIGTGCSPSSESAPHAPVSRATEGSHYENKMIRRPGAGAEESKVYVVQKGQKRWVVNAAWFGNNGFKFPEDVIEIPVAEFDAIPTGEPIP